MSKAEGEKKIAGCVGLIDNNSFSNDMQINLGP